MGAIVRQTGFGFTNHYLASFKAMFTVIRMPCVNFIGSNVGKGLLRRLLDVLVLHGIMVALVEFIPRDPIWSPAPCGWPYA